jgi:hypothetical protein
MTAQEHYESLNPRPVSSISQILASLTLELQFLSSYNYEDSGGNQNTDWVSFPKLTKTSVSEPRNFKFTVHSSRILV